MYLYKPLLLMNLTIRFFENFPYTYKGYIILCLFFELNLFSIDIIILNARSKGRGVSFNKCDLVALYLNNHLFSWKESFYKLQLLLRYYYIVRKGHKGIY